MKKILIACLCIFMLMACSKEENETVCLNARVKWGGDPAADGLGWYLLDTIGGLSFYYPQNLPENFKTDDLSVHVCLYETREKFYCMCSSFPYKSHIVTIRKN